MSTVRTKLPTAEEFFDRGNQPKNSDRYFELDQGDVTEMPTPGKHHGFECSVAGFSVVPGGQRTDS